VPPCNEQAIADSVVRLLRDEPLRVRLATQGQQTAEQYSWPRVAQRTLDLYEQCRDERLTKPHAHARFHLADFNARLTRKLKSKI
jgi:hypothetical protein